MMSACNMRTQPGIFENDFHQWAGRADRSTFTNLFIEQIMNFLLRVASVYCRAFYVSTYFNRRAKEKTFISQDLKTAAKIFVGNSVRGLIEANL